MDHARLHLALTAEARSPAAHDLREMRRGKFNECVANTSMFWASHALVGAVLPLEKEQVGRVYWQPGFVRICGAFQRPARKAIARMTP